MVSPPLPDGLSHAGGELAAFLEEAFADLRRLQTDAECLIVVAGNARAAPVARGIEVLYCVLEQGCEGISSRMADLGFHSPADPGPPIRSGRAGGAAPDDAGAILADYRSCFSRLRDALREARRISDAQTTALLTHLAIRLEKQLWLLGIPLHRLDVGDWRSVNLFSTC